MRFPLRTGIECVIRKGRVIVDKTTGMPQAQGYNEFSYVGEHCRSTQLPLGLNFNWKKFSASILFDYLGGYEHKFDTEQGFWSGLHTLTTLNNRERFVFPHSVYDDGTGKYGREYRCSSQQCQPGTL